MNGLELFIDEIDGRLHAAITQKGRVIDLYVDAKERDISWASMYLGKVIKVDKNLDAAIIDLGNGQQGFLPAKHVHFAGADGSEKRTGIAELVKPGTMMLVQAKSEAKRGSQHEQHKMPRLTTKLYIQGQYLVYCPLASQVTMSRKIQNEHTLEISARLKGKGGWIVLRTAEEADDDAIVAESLALQKEWQVLSDMHKSSSDTPRLLREGPNALARALFDYGDLAFDHIHAANRAIFSLMETWCAKFKPALATSKRLRLYKPETPGQKLFDIHDIYATLESLTDSLVDLPSGGSIIIEPTHALIVIDVNQGAGSSIDANIEAAHEVYRQTHLRNLSGAVLVDFIGISQRTDRSRLIETMEKIFAEDNAQAQVHGFTRLGIVEITRKRRTAMYWEKMRN